MDIPGAVTRRRFCQVTSAFAAAAVFPAKSHFPESAQESIIFLPDDGWRMWPDQEATWQDDALFLPNDVDIAKLPVHPPTGGWASLNPERGIPVVLPTSVEQYYGGQLACQPYSAEEYEYANLDHEVRNGAYRGVSWFWRSFDVPDSWEGKKVTLRIRGFRQRIEVFVNWQLAGYDLIAETSYACDVTREIRRGANSLAIRVTNPGGVYDWRDFTSLHWGVHEFHAGRGFGGLDRGISLHVHDSVFLSDVWVLNLPQITQVDAWAEIRNLRPEEASICIRFSVLEQDTANVVASSVVEARVPARSSKTLRASLDHPHAKLWSTRTPVLYRLKAELLTTGSVVSARDRKERAFGFRWFEPKGIGKNAILTLNGKRIRMYSAIEFGYWGFNGLWPRPALARKSDLAAKELGLNALQYHRNLGKHEELEQDDQLGLLRYMEPGGGIFSFQNAVDRNAGDDAPVTQPPIDPSGDGGDATHWSQRYMEFRVLRMIRDHRSHPSLVIYNLQNETVPDLHNPCIFRMLHRMHRADPSRTIILHSGIEPRNQVFYLPYSENIQLEDGAGYSGWSDTHTVGGPGVWQDSLYTDSQDFTQRSGNVREISMQGEMLGWGAPDNHVLTINSIREGGGTEL